MKEAQAEESQAQQLLAAAPVLSQSAKTLAETQAMSGQVPAPLPL
jgi:hypothetical protein